MKHVNKILIVLCIIFSILKVEAQPWMENIKKKDPTFFEIQIAFNNYWSDKKIEKGKNYKQFKRWEWFWSQRVNEKGEFPKSDILLTEQLKYNQAHNTQLRSAVSNTNANWNFTGPNVSNGGYAGIGRINCITFHPTLPNTFWVGTPAGGLWKTTDGGVTWATNTNNLPVLGVSDVAIDPSNANIMYMATGDGEGSYALYNGAGDTKSIGILKSTDGGLTWASSLSFTVSSNTLIRRLIMSPTNPLVLLAATSIGIYRTANGGASWSVVSGGNWFVDVEFKPTDANFAYATTFDYGGNAQIYRSANNGVTWSQVSVFSGYNRVELAVSNNSPALVSAVCSDISSGFGGTWISINSGLTFTQSLVGTCSNNMFNWAYDGNGCGGQGNYDLAHAINPVNANERWIGGVNSWKTIDGGNNWTLNNIWSSSQTTLVPEVHADKHFIAYNPLNSKVYECNDGGLYVTSNGGLTWTDLTNGLGISEIYRIGTSATVVNDVLCGLQDNGSKELQGGSWVDQTGGDGMECIIDFTNNNVKYATYVYGEISKTTDGGINWNVIAANNGSGVDSQGQWVTPYIMHPTNSNILLVGKDEVYKTTDGGSTWSQLGNFPGGTNVLSMAYAPSNTNVIYVATNSQIYKTVDGGLNWTLIQTVAERITYLAVDPLNSQKIWYTLSGYTPGNRVNYSSNGGGSWTGFSGTLPDVPVNCIVYQNGTSDGLYIGTDLGVYYRNSSMSDWIPFNTGLPNVIVNELEISYNNNKLWAATYGRGLWKSDMYCINPMQPGAISGSVSLCSGDAATYSVSVVPGATSYSWSLPGGWTGTSTTNIINVTTVNNGTIGVVSSNPCGFSTMQTLSVTINALPVINAVGNTSLICVGETATLTANGAVTYTWNPGVSGTSISVSPSVTTNYTLTGIDVNGCVNTATMDLMVDPCVSIKKNATEQIEVKIFPNPFSNKVIVTSNKPIKHIRIINVLGVCIYEGTGKKEKNEIDLSDKPAGVYFIMLDSVTRKVVKE